MPNQRILRFNKIESNDSLKFQVLKKLKLLGANNDLSCFDKKMNDWINRNPDKSIVLELKISDIINSVENEVKLNLIQQQQNIPDNYEFGNPLNRWIDTPLIKTESQLNKDSKDIEKQVDKELEAIKKTICDIEKYFTIEWTE